MTATNDPHRPLRVGIFGSALDTGNLGVSALGISTVRGLQSSRSAVECTLFDHGRGSRSVTLEGEGWRTRVQLKGIAFSRRFYRPGNLQQLRWATHLGLRSLHPVLRSLVALDAILDISGGDSFSDIYGQWRFDSVVAPKRLAIDLGVPLVLLPQTYGPYRDAANRTQARDLVLSAAQVWARDPRSLQVVRELAADDPKPRELIQGVDVAFGLPVQQPANEEVQRVLARARKRGGPILGVNVSGLVYNNPGEDKARYHFQDPYREIVELLLEGLLADKRATVILIPHVVSPCTPEESDIKACRSVRDRLRSPLTERIEIAPELTDPMHAKWLIGQCDWFTGMRMHACIGGLSQGIPTVAIAYSDKSLGVFETEGAGNRVVDPRRASARQVADEVVSSVTGREEMRARLISEATRLHDQWEAEFESIRSLIASRTRQTR